VDDTQKELMYTPKSLVGYRQACQELCTRSGRTAELSQHRTTRCGAVHGSEEILRNHYTLSTKCHPVSRLSLRKLPPRRIMTRSALLGQAFLMENNRSGDGSQRHCKLPSILSLGNRPGLAIPLPCLTANRIESFWPAVWHTLSCHQHLSE